MNGPFGNDGGGSSIEGGKVAMTERALRSGLGYAPTTRERLQLQLAQLEEATQNTREALAALDSNPGAEQVMNSLRKAGM